jgi:hypothetical protein
MIQRESNPEDVQKVDADESGVGGDDAYDRVRYGVMVKVQGVMSSAVALAPARLRWSQGS